MSISYGIAYVRKIILLYLFLSISSLVNAQTNYNPLGQNIQINTYLHSFVGKPIWTLIIHDVDNNAVYPYLFDFQKGTNHWLAFSYSRNYLITASRLQIETYELRYNKYKNYRINNFCNLESDGRILRNISMDVVITGDLSPYAETYKCHVSMYQDGNFYIYKPTE